MKILGGAAGRIMSLMIGQYFAYQEGLPEFGVWGRPRSHNTPRMFVHNSKLVSALRGAYVILQFAQQISLRSMYAIPVLRAPYVHDTCKVGKGQQLILESWASNLAYSLLDSCASQRLWLSWGMADMSKAQRNIWSTVLSMLAAMCRI